MSSCASSGFTVTEAPPSEELDVKAGGGCVMNIGEMLRHFLTKLEWYSTLFPRIPVPIQKEIEKKLSARGPLTKSLKAGQSKDGPAAASTGSTTLQESRHIPDEEVSWGEAERISRLRRSASRERKLRRDEKKENGKFEEEEDNNKDRYKSREKESSKREDRKEQATAARPSREEKREREWRDDRRSREREQRDRRSNWDIADEIAREKERQKKERTADRDYRSRSRSRDRRHRSRSRDRRRSRSRSRDHHHKDRRHRSKSRDHHVNHKSESRSRDRR